MKKRDSRQATFNFDGDNAGGLDRSEGQGADQSGNCMSRLLSYTQHSWQEVPQALFLSWSSARQLDYCARRDEDSALQDNDNRDFYLQRAADYRSMM